MSVINELRVEARIEWMQRRRRRSWPQPNGPVSCGRIASLRATRGEWLHFVPHALHCIPQVIGAGLIYYRHRL